MLTKRSDLRRTWSIMAYIHQNPRKHKFVDDFQESVDREMLLPD